LRLPSDILKRRVGNIMKLKLGTVQFHHRANDKAYNLAVVERLSREAAAAGVKILAFPEMCVTGYWHVRNLGRQALEALAEPVPDGAAATRTMALARELDMAIGVGLIERAEDGGLFNAYVLCQPDGSFACHRKLHAFENEHIRSGDRYTVIDSPLGVGIGILICYDNNLVENARATALLGADILIAPHQTGGCDTRSPFAMGLIDPKLWREREANPGAIEAEFRGPKGREWLLRWLPSRAHDNGMFLVFSNGVGEDDGEVRTGNAMIVDCYGRIIAETWEAKDKLVVAEADLDLLPLCTGRRWLRARRPELYGLLTQRFGDELSPRQARFSEAPVARRPGLRGDGRPPG
jgi:predicted amidohydrolase